MKTNKQSGEKYTENREELAEKYFEGFSAYKTGNLGVIGLLSDLQHEVLYSDIKLKEHYRQILNDIKCILITDEQKTNPNLITNAE